MKEKNGWGLTVEILFLLLFLTCLLIAFIGIKKMGLFGGEDTKNKIKVEYSEIETDLTEAGKRYVNEKYNNGLGEEILILRISYLKYNNYIDDVKDKDGNICSGYIEIYKNSSSNTVYMPYIKCKNYSTEGYDSSKDW